MAPRVGESGSRGKIEGPNRPGAEENRCLKDNQTVHQRLAKKAAREPCTPLQEEGTDAAGPQGEQREIECRSLQDLDSGLAKAARPLGLGVLRDHQRGRLIRGPRQRRVGRLSFVHRP